MPNINTLFSSKKDDSDDDDNENREDRFVGGIDSRGGGSGLAVQPNPNDLPSSTNFLLGGGGTNNVDSIFNRAEQDDNGHDGDAQSSSNSSSTTVRRTITMYRDGFVVDDGPYRRLDDPANADFLRSLAMGRTPRELYEADNSGSSNDVIVGLIDKRKEEYVEVFKSFSGQGTSLGGGNSTTAAAASDGVVFDPTVLLQSASATATADNSTAVVITSIAVRLINGKRMVVKISVDATVQQLAIEIIRASSGSINEPFRLITGYPPVPISDASITVQDAKLQNAQVQIQKAT